MTEASALVGTRVRGHPGVSKVRTLWDAVLEDANSCATVVRFRRSPSSCYKRIACSTSGFEVAFYLPVKVFTYK